MLVWRIVGIAGSLMGRKMAATVVVCVGWFSALMAGTSALRVPAGCDPKAAAEDAAAPLFDGGASDWQVSFPPEAPRPVVYAAEELTNVIARISGGAILPVVLESQAQTNNILRLKILPGGGEGDAFAVMTKPGRITLAGNSPRAVLFAVYAFLRDYLDARWYWPGPSGEFLPQLRRFDVVDSRKTYRSDFRWREMSICSSLPGHRHPMTERWFPKVFLNCGVNTPELRSELGLVDIISMHDIGLPYYRSQREPIFREHPEWFSLVDGKRSIENYAGCWSNADFTSWLIDRLDGMLAYRNPDVANLFVVDIRPRCECPDCTRDPDKSARFWRYYSNLRAELRKQRPGQHFAGLAYMEYMQPPGIPVEGLEYVEYGHSDRCWFHRLEDATCEKNKASLDVLCKWKEKSPLGIYGYEFDVFNQLLYLPLGNLIEEEMRLYRRMGVIRMKTEYSVDMHLLDGDKPFPRSRISQLVNRLSSYVWAACAFDPDVRFVDVLDDFCLHVYDAAAKPMRDYHLLMADAWTSLPLHTPWNYHNFPLGPSGRLLTPERKKLAESFLDAAAKAVQVGSRAADEVCIDRESFSSWTRLAEEARSGKTTYEMPELYGKGVFDTMGSQRFRPLRHPSQETRIKLYCDRAALHLRVECDEKTPSFVRGSAERDKMDWNLQSIELFIDTGDGRKRQIAVSPAGGVWDAMDNDLSWESQTKANVTFSSGRWVMDLDIPFLAFGGAPGNGSKWKFMAIRNAAKDSGLATCGWPVAAHGDFNLAATLEFSRE